MAMFLEHPCLSPPLNFKKHEVSILCVVKVCHTLCATFSAGYEHGEEPTDKVNKSRGKGMQHPHTP